MDGRMKGFLKERKEREGGSADCVGVRFDFREEMLPSPEALLNVHRGLLLFVLSADRLHLPRLDHIQRPGSFLLLVPLLLAPASDATSAGMVVDIWEKEHRRTDIKTKRSRG